MKLTADDYKRHYREISDEEFLAIDRDDLVEMARRCYDAELARRQLAPAMQPEAEHAEEHERPAAASLPAPGEELVQVGLIVNRETAIYAQKMLQEADIPAVLINAPSIPGIYADGSLGLKVPASCADAARELLAGTLAQDNQFLVSRWIQQEWTPDGLDLTDFSVTIDDLFGEEEKVAVRITIEGVNPKTGRDVRIGGLAIVRVVDGTIGEHWIKLDS